MGEMMVTVVPENQSIEAERGGSFPVDPYAAGAVQVEPIWTEADRAYGWKFGVCGVVRVSKARELLGGISRFTVAKLAREGKIRYGHVGGVKVICVFSIRRYIEAAEA